MFLLILHESIGSNTGPAHKDTLEHTCHMTAASSLSFTKDSVGVSVGGARFHCSPVRLSEVLSGVTLVTHLDMDV